MHDNKTLVFSGEDEMSARKLVQDLRARDIGGSIRSAFFFEGFEPCNKVIIMEDVPVFLADRIKAEFTDVPVAYRQHEPSVPVTPATPFVDRAVSAQIDQKDHEIAELRAQLAAIQAAGPTYHIDAAVEADIKANDAAKLAYAANTNAVLQSAEELRANEYRARRGRPPKKTGEVGV